jgi:hypothetical protein
MTLPDFLIIGAMKCGTTTLQAQLATQPGVFMSTPKEPNFFSDDAVYAQGRAWYEALFSAAPDGALKGEASTHYTKLPTYPDCADRMAAMLPDVRLVYLIRDPFERLVSHFIHEWSMGVMATPIDAALDNHPELIAYSRYAMQIAPYVARYGAGNVHVERLETMQRDPQGVLSRVGAFIGMEPAPVWRDDLAPANVSSERIRRFPLRKLLVDNPVAGALRRRLAPKALREAVKRRMRMQERPALSEEARARLAPIFDADAEELARLFPDLAGRA